MTPDRSVLITGANSGIGLATALELASADYDVYGTVRDGEKGAILAAAAADRGLTVTPLVCDVADADATTRMLAGLSERLEGPPWAVVNNAGYARPGAVEDVRDEEVRDQLEVNLLAPARLARLVLPAMRERGRGRIVMMSSLLGRVTVPFMGWYCASKHALEAVTDAMRIEVAGSGVDLVLVEPGAVGTGIYDDAAELVPDSAESVYPDASDRVRRLLPQGQHFTDPSWVARVVHLALGMPKPLARYLATPDAVAAVAADRLIPTAVKDLALGAAAGVRG